MECFPTLYSTKLTIFSFSFPKWAGSLDFFEIVALFITLFWAFICICLLCELGARMTNRFEAYNDELNRCNWFCLTIKMQRIYMIFSVDTQNPAKMLSYADITCERKTTKKVTHYFVSRSNCLISIYIFICRLSENPSHTL